VGCAAALEHLADDFDQASGVQGNSAAHTD
jgi:hypothetical protein